MQPESGSTIELFWNYPAEAPNPSSPVHVILTYGPAPCAPGLVATPRAAGIEFKKYIKLPLARCRNGTLEIDSSLLSQDGAWHFRLNGEHDQVLAVSQQICVENGAIIRWVNSAVCLAALCIWVRRCCVRPFIL